MTLILTDSELIALTGYKRAADQVSELRRQGFYRAKIGLLGTVVLQRTHYESVCEAPDPALATPEALRKVSPTLRLWIDELSERKAELEASRLLKKAERAAYLKTDKGRKETAARLEKRRISRAPLVLFHANKRRAGKIQRTPPWADLDAMRAIYDEAARLTLETGTAYHVDHVVPLQGKKVSGLHVLANLRILPASENIRKSNHFEVEA